MGSRGRAIAVLSVLLTLTYAFAGAASAQTPSPSPSPSASPSASPSESPTPSPTPSASPSASPSPSPTPSPTPSVPSGELRVSVDPGRTLAQVGTTFTYRITISNPGSTPLSGVSIHQIVPEELDVLGVHVLDEVDFTQLGLVNGEEDITWSIDSFGGGESLTLTWIAKVVRAADLRAVGTITAEADQQVEGIAPPSVYIATARGVSVVDAGAETVAQEVVRERSVTAAPGSILPATGLGPEAGLAILGLALVAVGLVLWRSRSARRRIGAGVIICALLMSACTSGSDEPDVSQSPEVKGRIIENDDETDTDTDTDVQPGDDAGSEDGDEPPDADADGDGGPADVPPIGEVPVGTTVPGSTEVVSETVTVQVPVSELPAETLGDTDGANAVALDWSRIDGVQQALSSLTFSDEVASVRTALRASGTRISVEVTLTNETSDRLLEVSGRLLHTVGGLPGGPTTLRSGRLDRTLAPGATIAETFVYTLPTGSFTLTSAFSAE